MAALKPEAPPDTKCCDFPGAGRLVPGEGPAHTRAMIIGQNPGAEEEKQGRPFVGPSGRFLSAILKRNNIDREKVYITNVIKCKTPENRKPTKKEIEACLPELTAEIAKIKSAVIVLMGKVAWQTPRLEGIRYIETYHRAAAARFTRFRPKFEDDIARINTELNRLK